MWKWLIRSHVHLFLYRCGWGLWWCNRTAAAPRPAADIWSAARRGWGNTTGGRNTWIPGGSGEDRPKEGGVIMGHCQRRVCVHSGLQHGRISSALLWPLTACLSLRHAGLRLGKSHTQTRKQMWRQTSPFKCAQLFVCRPWCLGGSMSRCSGRRANKQREQRGAGSQTLSSWYCEVNHSGKDKNYQNSLDMFFTNQFFCSEMQHVRTVQVSRVKTLTPERRQFVVLGNKPKLGILRFKTLMNL